MHVKETCYSAFQHFHVGLGGDGLHCVRAQMGQEAVHQLTPAPEAVTVTAADLTEADVELFERLRALRLRLAQEAAVPPYVIFHDATLAAMAAARPVTEEELLALPGIGEKKLATYGKAFLEEIMAAPSKSAEAE